MTQILTDSTSDLGRDLMQQSAIGVVPLYVFAADHTYRDGVDLTLSDLFATVERSGQLPKTSAPTLADFLQAFQQAEHTVYISLSEKLSATYQNALQACAMLPEREIHVVDSRNLSSGIGLLALKAAAWRDTGMPAAEIAARVQALTHQVHTSFVIETLDYLHKGGRCSALQNVMGSLLHIRPVITVRADGTLGMKSKVRGSRARALQSLVDDFTAHLPQIDLSQVFITHTGCDADAQWLHAQLMRQAAIQRLSITHAGAVIASHCGPDTIGVIYLTQ